MTSKNTPSIWELTAIFTAIFGYLALKFAGPLWVGHLYAIRAFDQLNRLSFEQGTQNLEFYQGRIQETLWGPAGQIVSFFLLAFIICRYFREISGAGFFIIIFLFLIATKSEVLFYPPYGDAIGGPFAEGIWLYQHGFNYGELFRQPNFTVGGPKVYFFSLYPGFLALTLKLIPWTKLFLAFHHLLTFALTAGIAAFYRQIARKSFEPVLSILSALVLLALPLFQSQSEAINMEIPVAFFAIGCAYYLADRRLGWGVLWACLASAIKGIGVVACLGAIVVLIYEIIRAGDLKRKLQCAVLALVPASMAVFIVGAKFFFRDTHVQQGLVQLEAGWPSIHKEFIFYLFLSACAVIIWRTAGEIKQGEKRDYLTPVIMTVFAAGWFLLFVNFFAVSPRYRVTLYPFLIFSVVLASVLVLKWTMIHRVLALIVLGLACYSSYGIFYGSTPDNDHVLLERSLEYRNDLELNRRLVNLAEERYYDQMIVAPFTIAQALAMPELGYVHKKLNVMIYGFGIKYGPIANFPGLKKINTARTVFIGVQVAQITPGFRFPVGPRDTVIDEVTAGNKRGTFFLGGYSIEALWRFVHGLPFN